MPSASTVVAFTSPEIGPSTIDAISLRISSWLRPPSFAISEGFVVTPQITPRSFAFLISQFFPVSTNNFINLIAFIVFTHIITNDTIIAY